MEPEVHLIEKYFQTVLNCFTMTNVKCKRGKEIDLLAIHPRTLEKFHVEARVTATTGFWLQKRGTHVSKGMRKGTPHRRGLDYFDKEKFSHHAVVSTVKEIFGDSNYRRILVVWEVKDDSVLDYAKREFGINIWYMDNILSGLQEKVRKGFLSGSRDDVIRTIELIERMFEIRRRIVALKIRKDGSFEKVKEEHIEP